MRIHKLVGKRGILTDTVRLSPEGFRDPDDAEPDSTWGGDGVSFSGAATLVLGLRDSIEVHQMEEVLVRTQKV